MAVKRNTTQRKTSFTKLKITDDLTVKELKKIIREQTKDISERLLTMDEFDLEDFDLKFRGDRLIYGYTGMIKKQLVEKALVNQSLQRFDVTSEVYSLEKDLEFEEGYRRFTKYTSFKNASKEEFQDFLDIKEDLKDVFEDFGSDVWKDYRKNVYGSKKKSSKMTSEEFTEKMQQAWITVNEMKRDKALVDEEYKRLLKDELYKLIR